MTDNTASYECTKFVKTRMLNNYDYQSLFKVH